MDPILDSQKYADQLDQLLLQLKSQIDVQCEAVPVAISSPDELDDYLLEVNSFYYESFAKKFLPPFRQLVNDDVRNLHHIYQQGMAVKQAVMNSIRHQARLFNQVKYISARLKDKRQEIQSLDLAGQPGSEAINVQLLYVWKELAQNWNSFLFSVRKLQNFLADQKMISALNQYPAHAVVSALLYSWQPQDFKAGRDLNRLLAAWQLAVKMLAKFSEDPVSVKDSGRLLGIELEKIDATWDNRKSPALLRTWYKQHIQSSYRLYLETVQLGAAKNNRQITVQAAAQLHDWLQALLYVVETGITNQDQGSHHFISSAYLLTGTDPDCLQELAVYSARILQTAEQSIQSLASSTRADYSNYSRLCSQIVTESVHYLRQQLDDKVKSDAILLVPAVEQLKSQLELLSNRLELLDEQQEYTVQHQGQYQVLIDALDANLALLQSIQEELVRQLSPRNLQRSFTDMNLHIEHLVISTGASFPNSHRHLVEEGLIQTQAGPEPEGRILSAAGDIFIIRLDELEAREIPAILISKEG